MALDETGVITSPWPKLDEGLARGKTLWGYVDARISEVLRKFGDKTLLIDGTTDEKFSYSEFRNLVRKAAVILRDHYQVTKDSVVLICSRNNLFFPVPVYATGALGAVAFSIPAYSHAVIPGFLESEPSVPVIFCDDDNLSFVKEYVASCESKQSKGSPKIVLLEGQDQKGEFETLRNIIAQCDASEVALSSIGTDLSSVDVDSEAVVFFSSASTGPPKPISHCHRGLISVSYNTNRLGTELEADEMKLFNVDLGHMGGFCFFLANISSGSTLIVFSNFKPERLLPTISRYRVNHLGLYAKDAIFLSKVDDWSMYDLSCVKEIFATASIFPTSVAKRLKEMFTSLTAPICQAYGSTELILAATSVECGAKDEVEAGIGLLVPYVKAKVVDLVTQEPLGPNEYGELWIHSPFRFIGYRNRPDLNAELISPDGWYKTGDYGYYDEKQLLHIIDRIKDLIRLPSGDVVSPSAIENIVLQHPGVAQVGVAGVPWPFGSPNPTAEVPRAFIIEKPNANLSPGDVVKFLEEKTSKPQLQLSGGAELINTMITSPGGKVYRYKLRADFVKKTNLQKEQSAVS